MKKLSCCLTLVSLVVMIGLFSNLYDGSTSMAAESR